MCYLPIYHPRRHSKWFQIFGKVLVIANKTVTKRTENIHFYQKGAMHKMGKIPTLFYHDSMHYLAPKIKFTLNGHSLCASILDKSSTTYFCAMVQSSMQK